MSDFSEEEEVIIENTSDDVDESDNEAPPEVPDFSSLQEFVSLFSLFPTFKASVDQGDIHISIPTAILPPMQCYVYGFNYSDKLLDIEMKYTKTPHLRQKPDLFKTSNPIQNENYIGKPLVHNTYQNFFSSSYKPKAFYNCSVFLFLNTNSTNPNRSYIKKLVDEGFDSTIASKTLQNCNNNYDKAHSILLSGNNGNEQEFVPTPISYETCPLFYLILEIVDSFLSIPYVCCYCGKKLPTACLKPTVCPDNKLCQFSLSQLGIGNSVIQEIRRDPLAADFVYSIFVNALDFNYLKPFPPQEIFNIAKKYATQMPSMYDIVNRCFSDADLIKFIGKDSFDLLQYVLFQNNNQFISLPKSLRIDSLPNDSIQFLTLTASPEKEATFQSLKQRYGSIFLFHGSDFDRWYSIFHNGLINASGTSMMKTGAALGEGIYFAPEASVSFGYCRPCSNRYSASHIRDLNIIALCEVAKVNQLKNFDWAYTLTNESACIVRFLIVGRPFNGTIKNISLPSLNQVLTEMVHSHY